MAVLPDTLCPECHGIYQLLSVTPRRIRKPPPEEHGDVRIVEDENRVRIFFPGKPIDETRAALKGAGFRWSPTVGAWQRHASNGAWWQARTTVEADIKRRGVSA